MKRFILLAGLLAALCLSAGCAKQTQAADTQADEAAPAVQETDQTEQETPDQTAQPEPQFSQPVSAALDFSGGAAAISGCDARQDGGVVTLTQAGVYTLAGTLDAGQLVIDAGEKSDVTLVLNGVSLQNPAGPAIYAVMADTVTVELAEGTENVLTSGKPADMETVQADETGETDAAAPQAALWCKNDLTIQGSGSLAVYGYLNNGVQTKDDLAVLGGSITVTAANNALKGNDAVYIQDGSFTLLCGGDAVKTDNTDPDKGNVTVLGGSFDVTADGDGFQADNLLDLRGGSFDILTGGGPENGRVHTDGMFGGPSGGSASTADEPSAKALKSGGDLYLSGGSYDLVSSDDCVHANGSVYITGGELLLATGDDGVHADQDLTVSGGSITITDSYEGLEGTQIFISAGTVDVTADDDGLNAGGGSFFGPGGMGGGAGDTQLRLVEISGGLVRVNCRGDGLDSNGSLLISGGEIYVSNLNSGANGAIDTGTENGGTFVITGGVLAATGHPQMAERPDAASTQGSILYGFDSDQPAGETLTLTASDGTVLICYTPPQAYRCVNLSAPGMEAGQTYTLTAGEQSVQITLDTIVYANTGMGGMGGGPGGMGGGMAPPR